MTNPLYLSGKHDWRTPRYLFDYLHSEHQFTIDAAASPENALLPRYWTEADDALSKDWAGERVFCNPPYGRIGGKFIAKAAELRAAVSVLLIPARTDTRAWHDHILHNPYVTLEFVKGRLRFGSGQGGAATSSTFPSAIVVFHSVPQDRRTTGLHL